MWDHTPSICEFGHGMRKCNEFAVCVDTSYKDKHFATNFIKKVEWLGDIAFLVNM